MRRAKEDLRRCFQNVKNCKGDAYTEIVICAIYFAELVIMVADDTVKC